MSLAMYRHALPYTTKPLQGPGVQYCGEVRYAVKMAEVIGPPAEVLTLSLSPVSPLTIPDHEAEAIMEIARLGIAFGPLPCPTAGTTAPFSIVGAIAQQNAEVLAALVLAELVHPGLADHILWTAGDDGTSYRAFSLGRSGNGNGIGRDRANRTSLWVAGQCIWIFHQCPLIWMPRMASSVALERCNSCPGWSGRTFRNW